MSQTQGVTVHPNRVFVKELPVDVDRQELMGAFSGFGWRIRTARVVNTNGSTNYGFLTFESKDEADAALDRAKSDLGILVRGKKVVVDHAFSRRTPPRRNSRQFSQAFQGLCRTRDTGVDVERDAQQHYIHQNYSCQYALSPSPDQRCASPASQMHYPMQSSQHYNNLCFDGRPVYLANPNQGLSAQQTAPSIGQNGHFSFQHGGIHDDARSPPHWPVRTAHHYAYEEHPESRFGGVHPPYVTTHHPGLSGPLYVKNPAEGVEAPNMSDRFPHSESATLQRADHQMAAGFHHQSQEFNHQDQVQQLHHQTQLVHQHLAQQQSLFHGPWIQLMQYQHPQSPRRNSDCSSN